MRHYLVIQKSAGADESVPKLTKRSTAKRKAAVKKKVRKKAKRKKSKR